MLGNGGVPAVAAAAHVHSNALASQEDLHCASGKPGFDLAAGKTMRYRVVMSLNRDMIIEPNVAAVPFSMHPRL
jgi:hypothetical protein